MCAMVPEGVEHRRRGYVQRLRCRKGHMNELHLGNKRGQAHIARCSSNRRRRTQLVAAQQRQHRLGASCTAQHPLHMRACEVLFVA